MRLHANDRRAWRSDARPLNPRARLERPIHPVDATGSVRTVAMLGNYVPRQCGIATFTTDLSEAIVAELSGADCFVLAMNDGGRQHAYPPRVRFAIADT